MPWNSRLAWLLTDIAGLCAALRFLLNKYARAREALAGKFEDQLEIVAAIRDAALTLSCKKAVLPGDLHPRVDALGEATRQILDHDAQAHRSAKTGVSLGNRHALRFFAKYLKAANRLLDGVAQLRQSGATDKQLQPVLERVRDLLPKLETAFAEEHQAFLRNDFLHFSADLTVIDTLLTMEGH